MISTSIGAGNNLNANYYQSNIQKNNNNNNQSNKSNNKNILNNINVNKIATKRVSL